MGERIGFIGLGRIGLPIALGLARAGHTLTAFDIAPHPESVRQLVTAGARVAQDLGDVVATSDIIITSLPDSDAVESVITSDAVTQHLRDGMVWIEMSSGFPTATRRFAKIVARYHDVELVDAPVCNGGVPAAYEARLTLCVGGNDAAVQRVLPVLRDVAQDIVHVGSVGEGHIMKLLSNYIKLGLCGLVAEAYAVALANGLSLERTSAALRHCVAARFANLDAVDAELRSTRPPETPPYFRLALARKDLRYLATYAASSGVFSPIGDGAHELYLIAERSGFADSGDVEGMWKAVRQMVQSPAGGAIDA